MPKYPVQPASITPTYVRESHTAPFRTTESKLDPHSKEITELRTAGHTLAAIRRLLAIKKVEVSISRLSTYISHQAEGREGRGVMAQKHTVLYDVLEDPLAILLLTQIKAQADRL